MIHTFTLYDITSLILYLVCSSPCFSHFLFEVFILRGNEINYTDYKWEYMYGYESACEWGIDCLLFYYDCLPYFYFFSSAFQSSLVFDCIPKTFQRIDRQTGNTQGYDLPIDEKKRRDEMRHVFYPVVSASSSNDNSNIYINTSFGFFFLNLNILTINIVI